MLSAVSSASHDALGLRRAHPLHRIEPDRPHLVICDIAQLDEAAFAGAERKAAGLDPHPCGGLVNHNFPGRRDRRGFGERQTILTLEGRQQFWEKRNRPLAQMPLLAIQSTRRASWMAGPYRCVGRQYSGGNLAVKVTSLIRQCVGRLLY
jgi:hypothetical protein